MIPLFWPPAQNVDAMVDELRDTLSSRWWGQGPKVEKFEQEFGRKFGFEYCVMTNSGTSALHLAYVLSGIRPGDSVVVPVLTCTATCHPLKLMGANIVFADIDPKSLTSGFTDFARKMTPKVKAVVPVHLGGFINPSIKSARAFSRTGISVIEDAAQALGAKGAGFGDFTCFSFQAIKSLSTGDGGMLVCRRKADYQRAKKLRWFAIDREQKIRKNWQAWDRRGITFDQDEVGYKYQPTDIDASIGLVGLKTFDRNQAHRTRLVKIYREMLKDVPGITLLADGETSNWLFMVLVDKRDDLAEALAVFEVETNVAHIRNDLFSIFGGKRLNLPGMNEVERKYLCLPLNDHIWTEDVKKICALIREIKGKK